MKSGRSAVPSKRTWLPQKLHQKALALYFVFYNFTLIHKTLRISPAMIT
jgi:hypothetical protein